MISKCYTGGQRSQLELRCVGRLVRYRRKFPQTPSNLHRSSLDSLDDGDKREDNGRVTFSARPRYQTDKTGQIQ
jgi:hypothetical protein